MNHIRGLFRPGASGRANEATSTTTASTQKSRSAANTKPKKSHRVPASSPLPSNARPSSNTPEAASGGAHGSATSSVASDTALTHLYATFKDNISASESRKAASAAARKPCMVMREINDNYYAPTVTPQGSAYFLPPEYHLVVDDDEESSGEDAGDILSDMLTRHRTTPPSTGSPANSTTAGITSLNDTATMDVTHSPTFPLTADGVLALDSDGDGSADDTPQLSPAPEMVYSPHKPTAGSATWRGAHPRATRAPQQLPSRAANGSGSATATTTNTVTEDASAAAGTAAALERDSPSRTQRHSASSWSSVEEEAKIRGQVRHIVMPTLGVHGRADQPADVGAAAGHPPEVEVVRLNEEFFTASEIARWRHYQIARIDSFDGTGNNVSGAPSTSTRSRDAPSSNSASGPEFMPMLGANAMASESSDRSAGDVDGETDAFMGVPLPHGRLIRVCYPEEMPYNRGATTSAQLSDAVLPTANSAATLPSTSTAMSAEFAAAQDHFGGVELLDVGSSHSSHSHDDDDASSRGTSHSSSSSGPGSSSSSTVSLEGEDDSDTVHTATQSTGTSSAGLLPSVAGNRRAPFSTKQLRRLSSEENSAAQQSTDGSTSTARRPSLPSVGRPKGMPAFQRRVA